MKICNKLENLDINLSNNPNLNPESIAHFLNGMKGLKTLKLMLKNNGMDNDQLKEITENFKHLKELNTLIMYMNYN